MPVSAGIYNALNQPVRSVADYAADYDQADARKQAIQRNALMLQESQALAADRQAARQMAGQRQNALQALMQQGGKPEDIEAGMLANPLLMGDGQAMRESRLKAGELDAKNRRAQFELQQQQRQAHAQQAASYQSPDEAIAHLQQAVTSGEIPPVAAQAYEKLIRTDPQWQLKLVMGAMNPEKMADLLKPVLVADDIGGSRIYGTRSQVDGKLTQNASVTKTQTPDSVASNARMAADAAAGRAQSASQFNQRLAYDKDKDKTAAAGGPAKPLPAGALKMQQESLDAIGISSSINADLGGISKQIETGKLSFGPIDNLTSAGLNAIGRSTENSRNFASFKSTLERLRNESLRLNSGVQTDGDAQRAWAELFQNINDTELVKQRLAEIQGINARGAQLHQLRVDSIRSNYNAGPLDAGAYRDQPAAVGGGAPAPKPAAGGVPRITGDADYNALPSGATFIGPDGKTRRKP